MGRVHDKVVIVTGASLTDLGVGIGGAVARDLVAEGARVVVADLNGAGAKALAEELNAGGADVALPVQLDLEQESSIVAMTREAVQKFGTIGGLVNNAGAALPGDQDVLTLDPDLWDRLLRIDLKGAVLATKHVLPAMLAQHSGSVVNTASTNALAGDVMRTAYGVAKAGLNTLAQYIATQYGKRGIRANSISPGPIDTPMMKRLDPAVRRVYVRHVLRTDVIQPEEIAKLYTFLISDDSSALNGQILVADGGMMAHAPFIADFTEDDALDQTGPANI
jgi:NAD(P)-dependent dehydrogenase (short-subunit alcohol dehydrogenase family)